MTTKTLVTAGTILASTMAFITVAPTANSAPEPKPVTKSTKDAAAMTKSVPATAASAKADPAKLPDTYWKKKLDPNTYAVTRCSATEAPFTGKYWNNHADGKYHCSNCGELLFESKDKFDSGTGWPSFTKPQGEAVASKIDKTLGMERTEVICKHCGAHLGHVFDDGPGPTRKRYCINSASLEFDKEKDKKTEVKKTEKSKD